MRSLSPQSDAPDVDTPRVRARTPRAAPASVTGASQSSGDISWDSVALGLPPHPGEPTASHISYDSTPPRTMEVGVGASSSTAPPGSTTSFEAALSAAMAPSQPASTHPKQGSHQASHESHSQVSGTEATSSALAASLSHLRAAQSAEAQLRGQIATNDALYRQLQQEHAQLQAAMAAMTSVSGSSVASSAHLAGQGPQTASSVSTPTPPPPPGMSPLRPAPPSDEGTPEHLRGVHSVAEEQSDDASSFSEHSLSPGPDSCSSSSHQHGGHEGGSPDTDGDTPESQHYAPLSFFQGTASQARSGQYAGQELVQGAASQARSGQYAGQELVQGAASQARSGQYAGQELLQGTASQARSGQYAGQELLQDTASQARSGQYAGQELLQGTASQARSGQYAGQELLQGAASQARSGQYAGQELLQGAASQARSGQYAGQELLQDTASQARSGQYAGQELVQGAASQARSGQYAGQELVQGAASQARSGQHAGQELLQGTASQARSGQYAGQELLQGAASQARSGQYAGQELLQGAASQARSGQYAGQELLQGAASQARSGQYAGQELLQGSDATVDVGVGLRSLGGRPATYRTSQHASYPPMHTASHSLGSPVPALRGGPTVRSTRQAHPSGQPGSPGIQYLLKKYGEQQRRTVVHSEQPAREGGPDGEEAEGGVQGGATRAVSPIAAALGPRVDAHAARALSHSAREAAEEAVAAAARSRAAAQAVAMVGAQGHDETVSTQTDSTDRTSALSASPVPEEVGPQAEAGAAGACGSHDAAGDIPSRLVPRPRQAFVPWPHPHYEWYNVRYDGQGRRQRLAACVRPWEAPHHSSAQQESKGGDTAGAGVPAPGHMDVSDAVQGGVVSLASYRDAVRTAEGLYLTMRSAGLQPDVRSSTGGKAPTTRERIRRDRALHCKRVRGARPSQRDQRCLASKNTQAVHALRAALQCIEDPLVDVPAPLPMPSKGGDEVGPPLHLGDLLAPSDGGQWRQQVAVAAASNPSPAAALKVNALHGAVEATKNPRELAHALATVLQEMCVEVGAQQVSEALPCLRKMAKASLLYPPLKRYANVVCDVVGAKLVAHDPDTGIPPVGLEESLYLLRDALGGHGH